MTTLLSAVVCTKCRKPQGPEAFRSDARKRNGLRSICRSCDAAYARAWQRDTGQNARWVQENPERYTRKQRDHLLRRYGITYEDYERLLAEQAGRCAICRTDQPKTRAGAAERMGHLFVVDHNHATGAVRGLLCMTCNSGIGGLHDDPALVLAALRYLLTDWAASEAAG